MPRKKSEGLTPNMQGVLDYYQDCKSKGAKPTLRKIADAMGWKATATAFEVLRTLRSRKLIPATRKKRKPLKKAKSIILPHTETNQKEFTEPK
jgi:SOS-response transcriptional repressor LexA